MSTRLIRTAGAVAAGALAAGLVSVLAAPASAAPDDHDYTRSIELSWDGTGYADVTTTSFLGTPVSTPGDSATRTVLVRNDGPTDGTLRATITNVHLLDPDAPDVQHHPNHVAPDDSGLYAGAGEQGNFYNDLQVGWDAGQASLTQLADNGDTQILLIPLEQGEQVPIMIDYDLPAAATSGNVANVSARLATFDVKLELGGEFPEAPTTPPVEPITPSPGAHPQPPALPDTGADLDLRWPALAVALLLGAGALLFRSSRRDENVRGHH